MLKKRTGGRNAYARKNDIAIKLHDTFKEIACVTALLEVILREKSRNSLDNLFRQLPSRATPEKTHGEAARRAPIYNDSAASNASDMLPLASLPLSFNAGD